jgi:hypothetical protein
VDFKRSPFLYFLNTVSNYDFVNWVLPSVSVASVDFVSTILETRLVTVPRPSVLISRACSFWIDFFKFFTPAWNQDFVHVQSNANVDISREKPQRNVPSSIKPPRRNGSNNNLNAKSTGFFNRTICRPSVEYKLVIRFFAAICPSFNKLFLILSNCVYGDFNFIPLY